MPHVYPNTHRTLTRYKMRSKAKLILVLCVAGLVVIVRLYLLTL